MAIYKGTTKLSGSAEAVDPTKAQVDSAIGASSSGDVNKFYNEQGSFEEIGSGNTVQIGGNDYSSIDFKSSLSAGGVSFTALSNGDVTANIHSQYQDGGTQNATDGQVLTANGSGGVAWEDASGGITESTGTWTPTFSDYDGTAFTNTEYKYVRQGSLVHCTMRFYIPDNSDSSTISIPVSSLPFNNSFPVLNGIASRSSLATATTPNVNVEYSVQQNGTNLHISDFNENGSHSYQFIELEAHTIFVHFSYITDAS